MSGPIVITGFGPFGSFADNPSSAVLPPLAEAGIPGFEGEVVVEKISVEYDTVSQAVEEIWKRDPVMVVHIGAHPIPGCIKLEQQSFRRGYCRYDIKGGVPPGNDCCPCGEDVLVSSVDCSSIAQKVNSAHGTEHLVIECSRDPGRYLCGFSYYLSLQRGKALFIHVPAFDTNVTLEKVVSVVRDVISLAVGQ